VDPHFDHWDSEVIFADGFPLLLISQSSLEDLNARLDRALPMERFRPNIVVSGCQPYAEDDWKMVRLGEILVHPVKPCARCAITTVDQQRGEVAGKEPLRTLAGYRRGDKAKVLFGQNLIHKTKVGELRVGDPVVVLE
ncbi:MAG: MOSC domain-containing protein, partial [Candidatus Competibacteraceae bacterium]|nr:MOSC domain-containing protein [Candidatus Competibacteraceae bacterium]